MFWYTYVLISRKTNQLYVGYTGNLRKRFRQHINGEVKTTKKANDYELIFYEAFKSKKDAQRREVYFKQTKGKRALRLMLKEYFTA